MRLSWHGSAGFISRSVYRDTDKRDVADAVENEAARSGFYNFSITGADLVGGASPTDLPRAVEYDVRQTMRVLRAHPHQGEKDSFFYYELRRIIYSFNEP